jgi:hypothetical protein
MRTAALLLACLPLAASQETKPAVHVRFRLVEPAGEPWRVDLRVRLHRDPWYSRHVQIPAGRGESVPPGEWSPWAEITDMTHGRMKRCGGVAEFPCAEAKILGPRAAGRKVEIELAPQAEASRVARRFTETAAETTVMFLVSRDLEKDAADLETGTAMSRRHLGWAREASGGKRAAPRDMLIATGIWGSPDAGLSDAIGETLHLLGFNVVGGASPAVLEKYGFGTQETLWADVAPGVTRDGVQSQIRKHRKPRDGTKMFVFSDEIRAPPVGQALAPFHRWLAARGTDPSSLGVSRLEEARPIDTWKEYEARAKTEGAAANRLYYCTMRFRQESATERLRWFTEAYHEAFGDAGWTATLPADHPYFGGSGLGGGDFGWGDVVACDWFDLARRRAVDMIHVEDWMGLQYMYGPNSTWEGFQLMGFQCGIYRSASRGQIPILALITPGDARNVILKSFSSLAQGARHFWYWHFGPTYMSTENYWSDIRGEYDGVVRVARSCAAAEDLLLGGRRRPAKVALLYSLSSDIWKPFGYAPMLERRLTWFSLVHSQYLVDLLTEEDAAAGRLADYAVLYVTDPCVSRAATRAIAEWHKAGGRIYGSCAAASRDEFNEPQPGLSEVFGIDPDPKAAAIPGRYSVRGGLNSVKPEGLIRTPGGPIEALGVRAAVKPAAGGRVAAEFDDGSPGIVLADRSVYVATCPALAYGKGARFVPNDLKEDWPAPLRDFINRPAAEGGAPRVIEGCPAVVEAGLSEAPGGIAVTLANFTYRPIPALAFTVPCAPKEAAVVNVDGEPLRHEAVPGGIRVTLPLDLADIVQIRWK